MRIILIFCSLLIFACGEYATMIKGEEQELYQNHKLLKGYFYHPDSVKEYEAYKGMEVDSMYESLKDYFCGANYEGICGARYTRYYPPEKSDEVVDIIQNTKKYYSFGFERYRNESEDTLIVTAVYPISPAASSGLRKRDKLLYANGVSLTGENTELYLKSDSAFDNSTVFVVLRDGERKSLSSMTKMEVQKPTVYLDSIGGIPYIEVTEFKVSTNNPKGTYPEFKNYLQEIKGAKAAILDLRSNGGGSIAHCTAMAAEMVPFNSKLVCDEDHYLDTKRGNVVETVCDYAKNYLMQEGDGANIKWVVLIDHGSASCSERMLAALKYNRPETKVIGQTSYGKGIGQVYMKTYANGLAYITCLQSYYPNGETFHNVGIIPDIKTEAPPDPNKDYAGYMDAIYKETMIAVEEAQKFGLTKRSSISSSVRLKDLPPKRQADNPVPGAYKRIEAPLFH